jgi:hypothetical protein
MRMCNYCTPARTQEIHVGQITSAHVFRPEAVGTHTQIPFGLKFGIGHNKQIMAVRIRVGTHSSWAEIFSTESLCYLPTPYVTAGFRNSVSGKAAYFVPRVLT